eukprot:2090550-Rhodomonas_salina.2
MYFVVSGTVEELVETDMEESVEAVKRAHSSVGGVAVFFGLRHLNSARAGKVTGTTCLRCSLRTSADVRGGRADCNENSFSSCSKSTPPTKRSSGTMRQRRSRWLRHSGPRLRTDPAASGEGLWSRGTRASWTT